MDKRKYRVFDGSELIGTYAAKEISGLIGCNVNIPSTYVRRNSRWRGRYRFEIADIVCDYGNIVMGEWARQWDEERHKILEISRKCTRSTLKR